MCYICTHNHPDGILLFSVGDFDFCYSKKLREIRVVCGKKGFSFIPDYAKLNSEKEFRNVVKSAEQETLNKITMFLDQDGILNYQAY